MDFLRVGLPQALDQIDARQWEEGLGWTCRLLGIWCLLSTAEWLAQLDLFRDRGLLSWRVLSLRPSRVFRLSGIQWLFHRHGVRLVLALRLAGGAMAMVSADGWFRLAALLTIILTGWMLKLRKWLSEDGADQMGQVVATGGAIWTLGLQQHDSLLAFAGVLLIAGQLTMAYCLGGTTKLISFEWRSGRALVGIMGTQGFGHDVAARVATARPWVPLLFCWGIILVETFFFVALVASTPILTAVLIFFALFHAATALFMGLNTYLWAFVAAYPAVTLLNAVIRSVLSHGGQ